MTRRTLSCLLALVALFPFASAQDADADALLADVTVAAEAIEDAVFLLTGHLVDADGTEIALEIEMQVIPDVQAASAYILQPDALADNIIVLDGDTVYNYTFLTNQVTVFDADDPDALGGLFGGGGDEAGGSFEFTFDLQQLFDGYEASLVGETDTPAGPATVLRLTNVQPDAAIARVDAAIVDETALPARLELYGSDDELIAELVVQDLRTDVGLDAAAVTFLPEDAEIIDERGD